jgi:energy-coupling factor transport system ATP-binding protein
MLKVEEVGFTFPSGETLLAEVSFAVPPGCLSILTGRNGAGKSTLLRLCNGLLKATAGRVIVNGQDTRKTSAATLARFVGTVFQSPEQQLFHSQVLAEVAFGPRQLGFSAREAERCARESLARVGMEAFAATHPLDLDRTSQRWVALAAALASKPKLLLIDEVQQGMDAVAVQRLENLLAEEKRAGTATLFVCHDVGFTARNADDILILEGGRLFAGGSTRK